MSVNRGDSERLKGKGERLKGKGERGKVKGERGKGKGERFQIHLLPLTPVGELACPELCRRVEPLTFFPDHKGSSYC
ncbi:hypothetical protein VF14_24690 [Nostoc linckia z18]|uniref:Uncharacterized protein n=2 Tax=Nostoc linckia TaxID=92942 RepID=A0A9Q5ZA69_NOSLI|nr:hypothetical protein VF02_13045 [Nostoc linckia z1]PHJ70935.1 hypothetical protein VF05_09055 [Nostoc linckia z3]PHJ74139.1 hypothetical protein VF03_15050 [Nostoc linckia z2]PHJ79313.1 hypothetical protein VF06_26290 [Nostoc linckia z4]PHJ87600.1 hypothetical protein VF07_19710 [Nostoc linckia z6]PHJ94943.1 hypothetical protein VF04_20845 [Nostoc linckia z7]PHK01917.1 hypothetical protein VF08_20665 [Nostoc linckia z8]PHK07940.1 hypothetical protein VF09_22105 [Nostoc linckia z9]PHK1780